MNAIATWKCINCAYTLTGQPICPECGRKTDGDREISLARQQLRIQNSRAWRPYAAIAVVGLIALFAMASLVHYTQLGDFPRDQNMFAILLTFVALFGTVVGPTLVLVLIASRQRALHLSIWIQLSWLVHVPWVSSLVGGLLFMLIVLIIPPPSPESLALVEFISLGGFLVWGVLCWFALTWWLSRVIRSQHTTGLIASTDFRTLAAWTLASVVCWGGSAGLGLFFGRIAVDFSRDLLMRDFIKG